MKAQQVKGKTVTLPIESIEVEAELQCRVAISKEAIEEYRDLIAAGYKFPPVLVVRYPDDRMILVDGFTRRQAYILAGKGKMPAKVVDGDRKLAIELACGANADHGVRRTVEDKRKAVRLAIAQFCEKSSRELAEVCGCSHTFVDKIRKQLQEAAEPVSVPAEVATLPPAAAVPAEPVSESKPKEKVKIVANPVPKGGQVPANQEAEYRDLTPGCDACGNAKHVFSDGGWLCDDCGAVWDPFKPTPAVSTFVAKDPALKKVETILGQLVRELDKVGRYQECAEHLSKIQAILNGG